MESSAISTLRLRATYRILLREGRVPDAYYRFVRGEIEWHEFLSGARVTEAYEEATSHVHQVELGSESDDSTALIRSALSSRVEGDSPWVLIGGPPCQAYSLAGRSRRANDATFASDKKHFLYKEYLRIIKEFAPPVFVMENVKGLLSSSTSNGGGMFAKIKSDLEKPGGDHTYTLHSLVSLSSPADLKPNDFVIKAEQYGVPQKRHRVILLGLRNDYFGEEAQVGILRTSETVSVAQALSGLPKLRSGISKGPNDDYDNWVRILHEVSAKYGKQSVSTARLERGGRAVLQLGVPGGDFGLWVTDAMLNHAIQHETRGHMTEDLKRYWFAADRALLGTSPRLSSFPPELQPLHKNAFAEGRPFEDRFRVQVANQPSTTVVSHISKDGHYYIHPDPDQMRSLTVREAARLQSFPDNYFFCGNRTQQYHQVGNAVPPLLANQIARVVSALFGGG
jgi:DNA (cytosine-5)-methyltransferase 1